MYSKTDLQYPEHARARETVKGRKIYKNKRSFHHAGPFLSASLAGVAIFTYLSSHELSTSADIPSMKPVAAAIVEPSFGLLPETTPEPAEPEEPNAPSSPSPVPAPAQPPVRVPAPVPEPTPDPIPEYQYEPVPEPVPEPSDPEPTPEPSPEPQTEPEIVTDSVIRLLIEGTNGNLSVSNRRKYSVTLNKVLDGKATVSLYVDKGSGYEHTDECGTAGYDPDGVTDGTVESGVWSGEVDYTPGAGDANNTYPAKLVMDYEYSEGTADREETDEFNVYGVQSQVSYSPANQSLEFRYPAELFGTVGNPEDAIESTSLQCKGPDDSPIGNTGPEIAVDGWVYVRYELAEGPEQLSYDAQVQIEAAAADGSTTEIQITNTGTFE